jgi:hypothetical protein
MKSPFCFGVFWESNSCDYYSRQPNHVKHLLSGLYYLLKGTFHLLVSSPGDPRGVRCSHFWSEFCPRFRFLFPLTGI